MRTLRVAGLLLLPVLGLPGCIRTVELGTVEVAQDIREQNPVRTATNLPPSFSVVIPARGSGDCPPRLRDDAVGATLDLYRAMTLQVQDAGGTRLQSFGDYRITPPGHYGTTSAAEGVRVNCARLSAVGLVTLNPGD